MKVLVTSIGKRVGLLKHLRKDLEIIGVDCNDENAGKEFVDEFYEIPNCNDENYINSLIQICKKRKVKGIIPLYEGEFIKLLDNKEKFDLIKTKLIISNKAIIELFNNKKLAYDFMVKQEILTPKIYELNEDIELPVIIKPINGMGSKNVFLAKNKKEINFFYEYVENSIIQEYIKGDEYTVDVLCDLNGNIVYVVPRKRIEVRAGEVSKSKTVKDLEIIKITKKIITKINNRYEGLVGPLTFQFIKKDGKIYFLELNTRFGGGVPLSFEAGADYSKAINNILKGNEITYNENFKEKLMIRYDEAIYK